MAEPRVFKIAEQKPVDRGSGIRSIPLAGAHCGSSTVSTGITIFPPGGAIKLHVHNTDESVTLLEGQGECEVDGKRTRVEPFDTTYVPAGVEHRFINVGSGEMKILWVYPSVEVTRTFVETGQTIGHLERYGS